MKLAITQVVSGIVIIMAALWVTGWMIYQAPHELGQRNLDGGYYYNVVPTHETLFTISRYCSFALPVLGILQVIGGTIKSAGKTTRRFWPLLNIAIGVVAVALVFVIATWGYPTSFHEVGNTGGDHLVVLFSNPSHQQIQTQRITAALIIPGLAALGVGIAQLVKSKKTTI